MFIISSWQCEATFRLEGAGFLGFPGYALGVESRKKVQFITTYFSF